MSFTTQPRKGSTTDSDANDDKQLLEGLGIVDVSAAIGEVEHQNEDVNLACSNVVRMHEPFHLNSCRTTYDTMQKR